MQTFVGINNVEHFADQLGSEGDPARRATLMRLLVEEEDRLGAGLEQLGVAQMRIAKGHRLIASQRAVVAQIEGAGRDPRPARELLATLVEVQSLFERYGHTIMQALSHRVL